MSQEAVKRIYTRDIHLHIPSGDNTLQFAALEDLFYQYVVNTRSCDLFRGVFKPPHLLYFIGDKGSGVKTCAMKFCYDREMSFVLVSLKGSKDENIAILEELFNRDVPSLVSAGENFLIYLDDPMYAFRSHEGVSALFVSYFEKMPFQCPVEWAVFIKSSDVPSAKGDHLHYKIFGLIDVAAETPILTVKEREAVANIALRACLAPRIRPGDPIPMFSDPTLTTLGVLGMYMGPGEIVSRIKNAVRCVISEKASTVEGLESFSRGDIQSFVPESRHIVQTFPQKERAFNYGLPLHPEIKLVRRAAVESEYHTE